MTFAPYQFVALELTSPGGVVMARWHSRHGWGDVSWDSKTWSFRPFDHSGVSQGAMVDGATTSLTFPRLPTVEAILRQAHREGWQGLLRVLHWPTAEETGTAPPATAVPIATMRGIVSLSALSLTTVEATLASSLLAGAGGGQFPPRRATTMMIGVPVVLEEAR
jgi:hypothetical protein